jgi:dTDP-4-dehydrorhamnose 3,5-epimerase
MNFSSTSLPGCFEIFPQVHHDDRGLFVKTFHFEEFSEIGLQVQWTEEYYSISRQNVLRGLHFQLPPHDHEKLVYCVEGEVFDAVVDLRGGSPTFGQHALFRLSSDQGNMLYIPRGMAHGFYSLNERTTMMYKVSTVYSPTHDTGILWSSARIPWPTQQPVLSCRDANLPPLAEFISPFIFLPETKQ